MGKKPLITRCGFSGTHYITKVLRRCNADVRHEKEGKDGTLSWRHATKSEDFNPVIVQYRNLRKIATTFGKTANSKSMQLAESAIKPDPPSGEARGVWYTYHWLKQCLDRCDWFYNITMIDQVLTDICKVFRVTPVENAIDISTKTASRKEYYGYGYWGWDEILDMPWGDKLFDLQNELSKGLF